MNAINKIRPWFDILTIARDCMGPNVFTNGCFDYLHRGHIHILEAAADYGPLFVGINSDASVRLLKGPTRPVNNEGDRATIIAALECVRAVFIIHNVRVADTIRALKPSHWVKGADYTMDTLDQSEVQAAKDVGTEIVLVPALSGYSTTSIINRL